MPRTMLKDEHWIRLRPILLKLNIYDKGNLRKMVEGVVYRMRIGCPTLASLIPSTRLTSVGFAVTS